MVKKEISTISLPVNLSYLAAIQSYIGEIANKASFSNKDKNLILLAVEEAVSNVVKHAFSPEEEATFEVICQLSSTELRVIIRDKGLPFDPSQVKAFSIKEALEEEKQVGLGFRLMKGSVDELTFHNKGFGGKEVHIVKFLHQQRIESILEESSLQAYSLPAAEKKKEKIPYHVQLLEPSQAIDVCRSAYRTYGYTYIYEHIYYPERIIEMTKTGDLISAVAVCDKTNEVMGHSALEFFGEKKELPELGMAFTKPAFRGQGCFNSIGEFLINYAKEIGITGMFAKAVTTHPFSQKGCLHHGLKECGMLIGLSPTKKFKKMEEKIGQRESLVLVYLSLQKSVQPIIYLPSHHKDIIEKIYKNIEAPYKMEKLIQSDIPQLSEEQSNIEINVNSSLLIANIRVKKYGKSIIDEVQLRLKELCFKKIEAINIYLDLCDPYTAVLTEKFEKMGFFFAGVLPTKSRQNLILQFLNNVPIDYSKIITITDFGTNLLSYVKTMDPNQHLQNY